MNLYEKLSQTEPGKHAAAIGDAVYRAEAALGKAATDRLFKVRAYLENLAIEELKRSEPWAVELAKEISASPPPNPPGVPSS